MVRAKPGMEDRGVGRRITIAVHATQAGISLVHGAAISAGVEVAGGASGESVAAKLHFPEECLAQRDCSSFIADKIVQLSGRWSRNRYGFERTEFSAAFVCGLIGGLISVLCSALIAGLIFCATGIVAL